MKAALLAMVAAAVLIGPLAAIAQQPVAVLTDGEVRKVDKAARKITIRHAPIENLEMPAMTMVFVAGEESMLDQVRAGDRIRFAAEKVRGAYVVVRLERQ